MTFKKGRNHCGAVAGDSRTADKFVVRLPDGMREQLRTVAGEHHRSMNSEIVARLQASFVVPEDPTPASPVHTGTWNPAIGQLVEGPFGISTIEAFAIIDYDLRAKVDGQYYKLTAMKPVMV